MSAALSRLVTANAAARDAKQVMSLALGAEVGALRIQTPAPAAHRGGRATRGWTSWKPG